MDPIPDLVTRFYRFYVTRGKGKYQITDNTKIGKERANSDLKNDDISGCKAHTNTWRLQ